VFLGEFLEPQIAPVPQEVVDRNRDHRAPDGLALLGLGVTLRLFMLKPYVDNWLRSRQAVSDFVHSFTVWKLMTDLSESLTMGGDQLFERIELFNDLKDCQGLMVLNHDTEALDNVSAPLGGLDLLPAQNQEHMAGASRIPNSVLFGIGPHGMNASNEGEIRIFYDCIRGYQHVLFSDNLNKILRYVQLSLWGAVDPSITWDFETLYELDEQQEAQSKKAEAEVDQILVDIGVLHPEEVRKKMQTEDGSDYADIDPDDVPSLKEEEEQGLFPSGRMTQGLGAERSTNTRSDGAGGTHEDPSEFSVGGLHHMNRHAQDDEMSESAWNSLLSEYPHKKLAKDEEHQSIRNASKGYFSLRGENVDPAIQGLLDYKSDPGAFDREFDKLLPIIERMEAEDQIAQERPNSHAWAAQKWSPIQLPASATPEQFVEMARINAENAKYAAMLAADEELARAKRQAAQAYKFAQQRADDVEVEDAGSQMDPNG